MEYDVNNIAVLRSLMLTTLQYYGVWCKQHCSITEYDVNNIAVLRSVMLATMQ